MTLPVIDVTNLTDTQIDQSAKIFDSMSNEKLLPIHKIDKDPVRKELDNQFALKVLGLSEQLLANNGPFEILRQKLSLEPSIRGHK